MKDPYSKIDEAEQAFLAAFPRDDGSISLSRTLFSGYSRNDLKQSDQGIRYLEFGAAQATHGILFEVGGQLGVRSSASGEEFVRCLIPESAGVERALWAIAMRFAGAKLEAFGAHLGAVIPAFEFGTIHAMTQSMNPGSGPEYEERKKQLDAIKLRVPDDIPRQFGLAALHLAAGFAIYRSHPELIDDRPQRLAELNAVGDSAFIVARKWASEHRPELKHLFSNATSTARDGKLLKRDSTNLSPASVHNVVASDQDHVFRRQTTDDPSRRRKGDESRATVNVARAIDSVIRMPGEAMFGLHSRYFTTLVRRQMEKPLLGKHYLRFGDLQHVLNVILNWGAQIAVRTSAESLELMRLCLRPGDNGVDVLWEVATYECRSAFELYRSHYRAEPASLSDLQISTAFLRHGFDQQAPTTEMSRFARRKLKVPDEVLGYEGEAALALNRGIAIARTYPEFIPESDRESSTYLDGDVKNYEESMDKTYGMAKFWSTNNRPDLLHLFT